MPKGSGDKPIQKVTIVKSGELEMQEVFDEEGKPIPFREEL